MTGSLPPPAHGVTEVETGKLWDTPVAITACLAGCCAGLGAYFGLPMLLDAAGKSLGFNMGQLGWIGSAESLGMLVGSIIASRFVASGRFRAIALIGGALSAAATLAVTLATLFPLFCALRLIAGIGNGLIYSASAACLTRSSNPARNFALVAIITVLANSLELWALPFIRAEWGLPGMYTLLTFVFIVPALMFTAVPKVIPLQQPSDGERPIDARLSQNDAPSLSISAALCLAGILIFNVATSAFWAYAEGIGTNAGLDTNDIATTLTLSNLTALTGSAIAYFIIRHYGPIRPLILLTAVFTVLFGWWALDMAPKSYVIGAFLLFQVWAAVGVLQFDAMAVLDPIGRGVALVPAAQGIGQSSGPLMAGLLLGSGASFSALHVTNGAVAALSAATFCTAYLMRSRTKPSLASTKGALHATERLH